MRARERDVFVCIDISIVIFPHKKNYNDNINDNKWDLCKTLLKNI